MDFNCCWDTAVRKQRVLVVDIGNRSVKIYITCGDELGGKWVFKRAGSDWDNRLGGIAVRSGSTGAVVVSVVPDATERSLISLSSAGIKPVVVSGKMNLPIEMDYGNLDLLGADRVATAVGAWKFYSDEADEIAVVDAGTAITFDIVRRGKFLGGAILPGVDMMMSSLHIGTAQLPRLKRRGSPQFPGKGTDQCIFAGVIAAAAGSVEYLWKKLVRNPQSALMVLTGGDAGTIRENIALPAKIDPLLLVKGAIAIYDFIEENGE